MPFRKTKPPYNKPSPGRTVDWGDPINAQCKLVMLMNENGGLKVKDAALNYTGNFTSNATWGQSAFGVSPKVLGTSDSISITHSTPIDNWVDLSVLLWVQTATSSQADYARLAEKGDNNEWTIGINSVSGDGKPFAQAPGSGSVVCKGAISILDNKSHLIGVSWKKSSTSYITTLYMDALAPVTSTDVASYTGANNILLGKYSGGTANSFIGSILQFRIWTRVLAAAEFGRLYTERFAGTIAPRRRIISQVASGIQFDAAANSGYQAAASTYTFNRTVTGSDTFLAVDVSLLSAGQTVTSVVDDNGGGNVAMTFIGAQSTVSAIGRVESWGLVAPTAGTKQIQVNLSGSIASASCAVSYTGVHQTSPYESFNSAQATNVGAADATVTITPAADSTWIHAAVATDDTAITANQTTRNNVTGAGGSGADEDTGPISPAAATAMSYTNVGALATWAIAGYAIRPVAAPSLLASGWGALIAGFRNMIIRA